MKIVIKAVLILIAIASIISSIIVVTVAMNFGAIVSFGIAIFCIGIVVCWDKLGEMIKNTKLGKIILSLVIIGIIFFIFAEAIILFHEESEYTEQTDVIIVLGAGLRGEQISLVLAYRLQRALEYLEQYPDTLVVVSGGKGIGESIAEAEAMKRYLVRNGISEDQIILEDRSTSTTENFKFSKKLLDKEFEGRSYSVCFSTNGFHSYRAEQIARKQGLIAYSISAKDVWYLSYNNHLREFFAVVKLWVLGY